MTTYSTTTFQTFTDNLLAHLQDTTLHPNLKNVLMCDGKPPASYLQAGQVMWFDDVEITQVWAGIGNANRPQNETYMIKGYISCIAASVPNDASGQTALTNQALTIFKEIQQELRSNPTQGITPGNETGGWIMESHMALGNVSKNVNDTARETAIEFQVEVKARL